jgi:hypothetical protein
VEISCCEKLIFRRAVRAACGFFEMRERKRERERDRERERQRERNRIKICAYSVNS